MQGVTEFAPVSSSAHLVIVPELLGWSKPSVTFDVMLHAGTLFAVVAYFRRDLFDMAAAFFIGLFDRSKRKERDFSISLSIVIASIPTMIIALLFNDFFESIFSSSKAVSLLLIFTGGFMLLAERFAKGGKGIDQIRVKDSVLIGLSQALAVAPGISRSGATISTGLFCGLDRVSAARFSFLLSIPVILGAVLVKIGDFFLLFNRGQGGVLFVGFVSALLSGYLCIKFLLNLIRNRGLNLFAYYCLFVGSLFLLSKTIN